MAAASRGGLAVRVCTARSIGSCTIGSCGRMLTGGSCMAGGGGWSGGTHPVRRLDRMWRSRRSRISAAHFFEHLPANEVGIECGLRLRYHQLHYRRLALLEQTRLRPRGARTLVSSQVPVTRLQPWWSHLSLGLPARLSAQYLHHVGLPFLFFFGLFLRSFLQ